MKLYLQNFRCYKNITLELPDTGIVLLYGTSGIGKTTILKAIHFAITGKENKCIMYGEKKCSVKLEYSNMIITRTKNPTHLILEYENNKYEDEVAQNIIYKTYGQYFNVTSYIAQKSIDSFLNMSLQNKLEFFNSIALRNINVSELKDKVKTKIKERKNLVNDKSNEIRILKNQLSSHQEPVKIKNPLEDKLRIELETREQTKLKLQQYLCSKNELMNKLEKLEKEKKIHEEKVLDKEKNERLYTQTQKESVELDEKIKEIEDRTDIYKCITYLYDYFKKYFINLEKIQQQKKNKLDQLSVIKKKIEDLKDMKEKTEKIIYTEEEQKIYNKIHTLHKIFDTYKQLLQTSPLSFTQENIKKLIFLYKSDLQKLEKKIEENTNSKFEQSQKLNYNPKKKLFCPSCKTSLSVIKSDICLYNHDEESKLLEEKNNAIYLIEKINNENMDLQKQTESLRKSIQTFSEMENYIPELTLYLQIDDFKTFYDDFQTSINSQKSIQTNILEYEKNLQILEKELSSIIEPVLDVKFEIDFSVFSKLVSDDFDMEEFTSWNDLLDIDKETILDIFEYANKLTEKEKVKLNMYIKQKNDALKKLKDLNPSINSNFDYDLYEKIKNEYNTCCGEIDVLKTKEQEHIELEKAILIYNTYLKELQRYESLKKQIDFCIKEEEVFIRSLNTAEKFLKILTDSETIAISNTIDNINFNIKQYTDLFFSDFQMQLTPYKETAKGDKKTGIDIEIYQNGEKVSLDALSGGEFDRCLLVIFLAFNNLTNSNILLLDECLSSLNSELVEDIVDVIKANLSNKLVLVTLHQANTGIFDHVIDVEKLRV